MHTQTCISQRHEHAHVHALTYSAYLYLHEQPGGRRRREGQNRSRSPVGLPPVPHNTRGLQPWRDWPTPWGLEVGREPPGERKATSLRDPRCTSLGTAVRPQVWECRVHLPQGSGDSLSPPHASPGLLQEPPASSCPCSLKVMFSHRTQAQSQVLPATPKALHSPAPAGLTSCSSPLPHSAQHRGPLGCALDTQAPSCL